MNNLTIVNNTPANPVATSSPLPRSRFGKGTLTQCHEQWANRPDDEKFLSLTELRDFKKDERKRSKQGVVSSKGLRAIPVQGDSTHKGLQIMSERTGTIVNPTHWSFGQLATLGKAPAGYLRKLPAPLAADCINYGLKIQRDIEDVGLLLRQDEYGIDLAAATGPKYGRVWDADICEALVNEFGDGVNGQFRVPGIRGKALSEITKENTTLYASDRDMFIFLADENNKIGMENRRDGNPGQLSRGFFVWNSEVGDKTLGAAFFLFDEVCQNRIVWGVQEFKEIRLKHTVSTPDKWLHEITPILTQYANSAAGPVEAQIKAAQQKKIDDLDSFLNSRFTKQEAGMFIEAHNREEGKPIESLWDLTTAITAHAKTLGNADLRVAMEREGGKILAMAA